MKGNPFRHLPAARRSVAVLLVVALLSLSAVAHAAPRGPEAAPEDVGKLLAYTGCAVSIAIAATTAQVYFAVFGCVRMLIDEVDW